MQGMTSSLVFPENVSRVWNKDGADLHPRHKENGHSLKKVCQINSNQKLTSGRLGNIERGSDIMKKGFFSYGITYNGLYVMP